MCFVCIHIKRSFLWCWRSSTDGVTHNPSLSICLRIWQYLHIPSVRLQVWHPTLCQLYDLYIVHAFWLLTTAIFHQIHHSHHNYQFHMICQFHQIHQNHQIHQIRHIHQITRFTRFTRITRQKTKYITTVRIIENVKDIFRRFAAETSRDGSSMLYWNVLHSFEVFPLWYKMELPLKSHLLTVGTKIGRPVDSTDARFWTFSKMLYLFSWASCLISN